MKVPSKKKSKPTPKRTPTMAIAVGFWDAFGEWTPNTPRIMAEVALKALERDGYEVMVKGERGSEKKL